MKKLIIALIAIVPLLAFNFVYARDTYLITEDNTNIIEDIFIVDQDNSINIYSGDAELYLKFYASQISSEYTLVGSSLRRTVKANSKEKTEVVIGNENASSFEPSFQFKKWDEVSLKLKPRLSAVNQVDKDLELSDNKIKYKTPKDEIHFYELPESASLPEGGYEIERILNERPDTNVVSFDLETTNLEFFYQPIYSEAEIAVQAEQGNFINPDFMGSYAVYYKNVPLNYTNGKLYRTGKVGQIMRPKIDDAAGNWTYGDLNIDESNGLLTITIPQDFIDNATYPIYHASGLTFGYTTIGTAGTSSIENNITGSIFLMGSLSGTVDSITVYSNPSSTASRTYAVAMYFAQGLALVANSPSGTLTPTTGAAWRTHTYATKPIVTANVNYIIAQWGSNGIGTHVIFYDAGTTGQGKKDLATFSTTWPDPMVVSTTNNNKYSIYATYLQNNDQDNDGVIDVEDNCLMIANLNQEDSDHDGYGNTCDGDFNNDNVVNDNDLNLLRLGIGAHLGDLNYQAQIDSNSDGVINLSDISYFASQYYNTLPGPSGLNCAGNVPCPIPVVYDNFDSYHLGSLVGQGGWTDYANGYNFVVHASSTQSGANSIYIWPNSNDSVIYKAGTPLSDGRQKFYVKTEDRYGWADGSNDGNFQIRISRGPWSGVFAAVSFKKDGHVAFYNPVGDVYTNFGTYNDYEWNLVEVEWHTSNTTARYRINNGAWTDWYTYKNNGTGGVLDYVGIDFDQRGGGYGGVYFDTLY